MFLPYLAVTLAALVLLAALPVAALRLSRAGTAPGGAVPFAPVAEPPDTYAQHSVGRALLIAIAVSGTLAAVSFVAEIASTVPAVQSGTPTSITSMVDPGAVGLSLAPFVFGLTGMTVVLRRERHSPMVTTSARHALLVPRRAREYVRPSSLVLVAGALACLLILLCAGLATGDPSGAALTYDRSADAEEWVSSMSWPGWLIAIPALALTVAQLLLAVATLRRIASRSQVTTGEDAGLDDLMRRRSADAVVGLLLISLALPLLDTGLTMGPVLGWALGEHPIASQAMGVLGAFALACAVMSLVVLAAGVALLVRRPRFLFPDRRGGASDDGARR